MQLSKQSFITSEILCSLYIESNIPSGVPKSKLTPITDKTDFDGILQSEIYSPVFGGMHTLNFYNKLLKALLINHWLMTD